MKKNMITERIKNMLVATSISYIVSFVLLLIITVIMFYGNVSEEAISGMIMGIYFLSCMSGGIVAGKKAESRKFLWGIISGILYTIIICLIAITSSGGDCNLQGLIIVTILTTLGGMIGGMMS